MRTWSGRMGWIIPILLLVSLALNILALILPFLEIDEVFHAKVIYSLPHSVYLLWEHELYLIALLILGFSIIFPFIKLFSLLAAWFMQWNSKSRVTFLHWIELLGKWSYMDIFVVILLIALTSRQTMITSEIHIGVYFFVGAITLSMVVSQIVLSFARKIAAEEEPLPPCSTTKRWMLVDQLYLGWIVPVLVVISAAALIESLHATFLRISQFFMVSRSYSIAEIAEVLRNNEYWVLLIIMVGSIAVVPLFRLAFLLVIWIVPMKVQLHLRGRAIVEGLSRWSMLDVFGIALFLVTAEGKDLVKTEIQSGLYVVVAAIGLSYLLGLVAVSLHKAMVKADILSELQT